MFSHYRPSKNITRALFVLIASCLTTQICGATPQISGATSQISGATSQIGAAKISLADGLYSDAQAARGAEEYSARCASCHAADLRGNSNSPSLIGLSFMFIWEGKTLGELFNKMSAEMPTDNPGGLSQQSYAAILAYILQKNEFPSGDTELPSNSAALDNIVITSQ